MRGLLGLVVLAATVVARCLAVRVAATLLALLALAARLLATRLAGLACAVHTFGIFGRWTLRVSAVPVTVTLAATGLVVVAAALAASILLLRGDVGEVAFDARHRAGQVGHVGVEFAAAGQLSQHGLDRTSVLALAALDQRGDVGASEALGRHARQIPATLPELAEGVDQAGDLGVLGEPQLRESCHELAAQGVDRLVGREDRGALQVLLDLVGAGPPLEQEPGVRLVRQRVARHGDDRLVQVGRILGAVLGRDGLGQEPPEVEVPGRHRKVLEQERLRHVGRDREQERTPLLSGIGAQ